MLTSVLRVNVQIIVKVPVKFKKEKMREYLLHLLSEFHFSAL